MKCRDCFYRGPSPDWANADGWNFDGEVDIAECRRLPPTFNRDTMTHKEYGTFPVVFLDDYYCGEWRSKRKSK